MLIYINTTFNTNRKKNVNKIRTRLNGETLRKPFFLNCLGNNQASVSHEASEIYLDNMQKDLQNLDNPMLRGSYILVLSVEQIENLETIAKLLTKF